jgi:hypothetical protein
MSAFEDKADMTTRANDRYSPKSGHLNRTDGCLLSGEKRTLVGLTKGPFLTRLGH